jgi:hypothetical protein
MEEMGRRGERKKKERKKREMEKGRRDR